MVIAMRRAVGRPRGLAWLAVVVGGVMLAGLGQFAAQAGALEDYVKAPDSSFQWKRTEQIKTPRGALTHLELISQTWRGLFWSHHLLILRPEPVRYPRITAHHSKEGSNYNNGLTWFRVG
jgi:hypothetical protein